MKIFISHASEDKDGFVAPLALELKKHYEVWYDDYSLKMGDSLRASIDAGLRSSDFGVVVVSPRFIAKKWTNAELNGMFALETATRKMILPVWLDISAEQVAAFSPMLADKKAVRGESGLAHVVESIVLAVDVSARSHDLLDPDAAKRALKNTMSLIASHELDERVLRLQKGVEMFIKAYEKICHLIWLRLSVFNDGAVERFSRPNKSQHYFLGPTMASLVVQHKDVYQNSVSHATLLACIHDGLISGRTGAPIMELGWNLTCIAEDKIGFKRIGFREIETEEQVASAMVEAYAKVIEDRVRKLKQD